MFQLMVTVKRVTLLKTRILQLAVELKCSTMHEVNMVQKDLVAAWHSKQVKSRKR